jgi:transcriptional regulator with XRE-family HTH domain
MEQESTRTRLAQALGEAGLTQAELARRSGIDRSSISLYLSGRYCPKADKLLRLAQALGVSPQWLSGGEEEPEVERTVSFPVITGVTPRGELTDSGEMQSVAQSALGGLERERFFVLRVQGLAMYPRLLEGDRLLVLRDAPMEQGQMAVLLHQGALTVRALGMNGQLQPANPEFPPWTPGAEDRILGRAVLLLRQL